MNYQKLCEQFIKENWIETWSLRERDEEKIRDFAKWLDDQQKSGGKKKIEELKEIEIGELKQGNKTIGEYLKTNGARKLFDKLNQLIKSHNENL